METSDNRTLDEFLIRHKPDQSPLLCSVGMKIDAWEICAFVGRGGNGEVYRVQRTDEVSQVAALKILTKSDVIACARFEQERELLSKSDDRSLPRYFGAGEWQGRPYFVIEYLEPAPLPQSERQLADYLNDVCRALAPLHAKGVIHRDLKPSNIMRRSENEIVLVDLGLAKSTGQEKYSRQDISIISGKVVAVGTPGYAAPEQMQGGEISAQTDIHALGVLIEKFRESVGWKDLMPPVWHEIVRRSTSSISSERYSSVEAFATAVKNRNRPRFRRIAAVILLAIGLVSLYFGSNVLPRQTLSSRERERQAFAALCSDITTNVVSEELVRTIPVTNYYGGFRRVTYKRLSRVVTNRVNGVLVSLNGAAHRFENPIQLGQKEHCYIRGPGSLDAIVIAETNGAVAHISNCIWVNPTRCPLAESKIVYSLEGGAGLFFPNLDTPKDSLERGNAVPIFDGANNQLKFGDSKGIEGFEKVRQIPQATREYKVDGSLTMDRTEETLRHILDPNRILTEAEAETIAYCFDISIAEARCIVACRNSRLAIAVPEQTHISVS